MKRFSHPSPTRQLEIMGLLDDSPMPWNKEMLMAWTGIKLHHANKLMEHLVGAERVWRCAMGFYTSINRKPRARLYVGEITYTTPPQRTEGAMITDDMLARFGFNL